MKRCFMQMHEHRILNSACATVADNQGLPISLDRFLGICKLFMRKGKRLSSLHLCAD